MGYGWRVGGIGCGVGSKGMGWGVGVLGGMVCGVEICRGIGGE